MRPLGIVLVDTNVIIEAHDTGCWNALSGALPLETVEACLIETQDGWRNRPVDKRIDVTRLRGQFQRVNTVDDLELAKVALSGGGGLDVGESALWAHALGRSDAWVLCGPDRASMRFGCENGCKDRLVSLGGLLATLGIRPQRALQGHYGEAWLAEVRTKAILGIL